MITAMQELIEYFNERPEYDKTSEGYEIIEKAKQLLKKEKEQIIDAFDMGKTTIKFVEKAEDYYNQTYNQNK
jgi:hypothetical protein